MLREQIDWPTVWSLRPTSMDGGGRSRTSSAQTPEHRRYVYHCALTVYIIVFILCTSLCSHCVHHCVHIVYIIVLIVCTSLCS